MKKYKVVGIVPGRVHTRTHGIVDFSQEVPEATMDELYNNGFPYLELEKVEEAPETPTSLAGTKKADKPKPQES